MIQATLSEVRESALELFWEMSVESGRRILLETEPGRDPFFDEEPEDGIPDSGNDLGRGNLFGDPDDPRTSKVDKQIAQQQANRLKDIDPHGEVGNFLPGVTLQKPDDIIKYLKRAQNNVVYKHMEALGINPMNTALVVLNRGGLYKVLKADFLFGLYDETPQGRSQYHVEVKVEGDEYEIVYLKDDGKITDKFPKHWKLGTRISMEEMKKVLDSITEYALRKAKGYLDQRKLKAAAQKKADTEWKPKLRERP